MAAGKDWSAGRAIHPLHAVLLAGAWPLFLGGLLCDWTYSASYQIQWSNFAAWLIAGAMLFVGFALLWAFVDLARAGWRQTRPLIYFLLLLLTFVLGLINNFVHARDAYAVMPDGLILSVIVTLLAIAATWMGFATYRPRGSR